MADPNEKPTHAGQTRTIDYPGGRLQDQKAVLVEVPGSFGQQRDLDWVDEGSPYYPQREPRGPAGPSFITIEDKRHDNELADAKFQYQQEMDRIKAEAAAWKAELDKLKADRAEAWKQKEWERAAEIQAKIDQRQEKIDAINEQQRQLDNDYRDKVFGLEQKKFEAQQANEPGNYFNYAFRSRGMEPPELAKPSGATGTASAPPLGTSTAQTRDIANWRNMSINELLATFSATELATLPLEALSQFSNEALLKIGEQSQGGVASFLKLFPMERQLSFGQEVQQQYGLGSAPSEAPAAPLPSAATTPMYLPAYEAENPNVAQQLSEWQKSRIEHKAPDGSPDPQDPNDSIAFREHLISIGAPDPGLQAKPGEAPGPFPIKPAGAPAQAKAAVPTATTAPGEPLPIGGVGPVRRAPELAAPAPSQLAVPAQAAVGSPRTPEEAMSFAEQIKREMAGVR